MQTFKQWCLLLSLWALVVIALVLGSPVHAQVAAGASASSSSSSTTTTTTTATQAVAPQILQLPTMAYQLPAFQAPLPCPAPTFGTPLGYGYSRSFGAGFGYGRAFGAGFGYGHSVGFRRGFAAPVYSGVSFAPVRGRAFFVPTPVAPVVPVKTGLFGRLRVPRGFR